jgi:uncharacterized protein YndB with AHSA1/START domain
MIDFTVETRIERPVEEVFGYVTDPDRLPTWQTNTVYAAMEGGGPLAEGSRIREVHRAPGGRRLESTFEVTALRPHRLFAMRAVEGSAPVDAEITFEPDGSATRMCFRVHGQPSGTLRLLQPLLRAALRRQFKSHCGRLKEVLEAEPRASVA